MHDPHRQRRNTPRTRRPCGDSRHDPRAGRVRLTSRQRKEMSRHLRLVNLQLSRQNGVSHMNYVNRHRDDLFQEGCLALAHAIARYEPPRHGPFAPYAVARIHHAMGVLLRESGGIRVPMTSQRRRRLALAAGRQDPHTPPREVGGAFEHCHVTKRRQPLPIDEESAGRVLGHLLRARVEHVARHVVCDMASSPRAAPDTAKLLARCLEDRWLIRDESMRTPIRELAESFGSAGGRVTHLETAFKRRLMLALREDAATAWLYARGRSNPEEFQAILDPHEMEEYGALL